MKEDYTPGRFEAGEAVEFDRFQPPFRGKILGPLTGFGPGMYYVQSTEGEVRIFAGGALQRV